MAPLPPAITAARASSPRCCSQPPSASLALGTRLRVAPWQAAQFCRYSSLPSATSASAAGPAFAGAEVGAGGGVDAGDGAAVGAAAAAGAAGAAVPAGVGEPAAGAWADSRPAALR